MSVETELMINRIPTIERPEAGAVRSTGGPAAAGEASFAGELGKALESVNKLQVEADQQARLVSDGGGNLHEVAIALEKADVAMRLAMKVRNKLVEAYNEIMRMSV